MMFIDKLIHSIYKLTACNKNDYIMYIGLNKPSLLIIFNVAKTAVC